MSGVGFGFGDVTLENFLVTHNLVPDLGKDALKVLVARFDDVPVEKYMKIAETLRNNGITAGVYTGIKKFGKQIDYAVKGGYTHVVIMGGDELAAGKVKIKSLATREETVCDADKVAEALGE